jgi:Tol biopolymer transport system component
MTDRADLQMREVAIRLAGMAPEAPPFPEPGTVVIETERRSLTSPPRRPLVWVAAGAVAILAIIGLPLLLSSDDATPPATEPPPVPTTQAGPSPDAQGLVVVPGGDEGPTDIYVVLPGAGPVRLTEHSGPNAYAAYPSLSPDRTRILFEARRDGLSRIQIYAMNTDGSDVTRISRDASVDAFGASWSPDGSMVLFVKSNRAYSNSPQEIWVMNADGSSEKMVAAADARGPLWSPDGSRVAYLANGETWVAPIGGDPREITDLDAAPTGWSPDGSALVVEGARGAEPGGPFDEASDLWVVDADGSSVTRLTDAPGRDWGAQWSPDGTRIVFTSNRGGDHDIYLIEVEGGALVQLTDEPGHDGGARWSGDGTRIVFLSGRSGQFGVYVMGADGSDVTPLWSDVADAPPTWFLGIDWSA